MHEFKGHAALAQAEGSARSLRACCARCGLPLPDAGSGVMVMGMPGVGTFHGDCKPTWRHLIVYHVHRWLMPKPRMQADESE